MIKFIYFDVGGVVILDYSGNNKWYKLKRELGIPETNDEAFSKLWSRYSRELCTSRHVDTLVPIIKSELGATIDDDFSLFHAMIRKLEPNPSFLPVLKYAQQHAKIGLLTNLYPNMYQGIIERAILPDLPWDAVVDSSIEGCQKPDAEFLKIAEDRAGLSGQDILFIDNMQENVDAAKKFGWQAYFYDSADPAKSSELLLTYLKHNL